MSRRRTRYVTCTADNIRRSVLSLMSDELDNMTLKPGEILTIFFVGAECLLLCRDCAAPTDEGRDRGDPSRLPPCLLAPSYPPPFNEGI
jgi:hypothetical protein